MRNELEHLIEVTLTALTAHDVALLRNYYAATPLMAYLMRPRCALWFWEDEIDLLVNHA